MKIRNNNPLDLAGQDKERITVKIEASGTVSAVAFDLDGTSDSFDNFRPFTLKKDGTNPSILVLFFTFSNPGGGVYSIQVKGSKGGDTSQYTVTQFEDEASNAIAYTFDIV